MPGDAIATGRAVDAHPLLFRGAISSEVLTSIIVLVLAWALYRLFKAGYVPRGLAALGVVSYALVFLYDSLLIASPRLAANVAVQVVGWGPSVLFEAVAGPWLLIRGVGRRPEPSAAAA